MKYQEATGTPEHQEWLRHCDAYPEERRQIERRKKIRDHEPARASEASRRISYLEGHLLAEFIRKRHADQTDPILHWLKLLETEAKNQALFCYGGFNFKRYPAQIERQSRSACLGFENSSEPTTGSLLSTSGWRAWNKPPSWFAGYVSRHCGLIVHRACRQLRHGNDGASRWNKRWAITRLGLRTARYL